ncbi:GNAT family N-acetyltransferase [Pararhizobium haloflavum]|uniref:GNAT family N-acetyltransferase n=1 Tax=Pararhizobium haloflavum TaxID=2037914 RepID=UPI00130007C4|nr:GNAT family N-acetyltransferase [Pararhizobium haloflavum]
MTADIERIAHISSVALAGYPEDVAIFEELLALAPAGCFVLEMHGEVCGYLVSHPWMRGRPPALNETIGSLPAKPDSWYIHDLSLLEQARGYGAAREAVEIASHCARQSGLAIVSLVAVNGAAGFWQAQGFGAKMSEGMSGHIASYGDDALYMERAV